MVDGLVGGEGDGGASSDRDSGGAAARVTASIASQVLVRKVGDGTVVGNGPDVLEVGTLHTVGGELLEDVLYLLVYAGAE